MSTSNGEATESVVADENPTPDPTQDAGENASDETAQPQDDTADDDGDTGGKGRVAREAAKWRTKFREAETTIAEQAAMITQLREMHVSAAIARAGVKPAAVFAVAPAGELLDDNGLPDLGKISAAISKARTEFGITTPTIADHRRSGMHSGAGKGAPIPDSFGAAFTPRGR